jgi:NAD dependent epimerase/dehydratase
MAYWEKARVVVTGAGGFIGSHLVERLLELGADVTAFVRYTSRGDAGGLGLIGKTARPPRIVAGEVREPDTVRRLVRGSDVVFHLAALVGIPYSYVHPDEVVEVNTVGTLNVLSAAREAGTKRVVAASTSEVYGSALRVPIDEEHPRQPQSPYSASKIASDAIALSFHRAFDLPVAVVRPFNTYGPRQSDRAIIPTIISQALARRRIRIGSPAPTRDFTYVTDTVEGLLRAGEREAALGEEINLGTGREISIGELAKCLAAMAGPDVTISHEAERVRPAKSEVMRLVADNAKARRLLEWEPRVPLDEGLRKTMAWIVEHPSHYDPDAYRI